MFSTRTTRGLSSRTQACTRIFQECLRVASDLPEFGPPDPGERLARRASDHDIDRVVRSPEAQPGAHALWGDLEISQILRHRVTGAALVEIAGMTGGGLRVGIETCQDREASALQPERQAATPREEIEDPGHTPLLQPGNLRPDWLILHRS